MPAPETRSVTTPRIATFALAAAAAAVLPPGAALAQRFENQVAVFAALDKVTARISKLEVELNKTTTFGSLKVTPRVCYTRAPDEPPKTTTFVEVEETMLDGQQKRLFSGWMFAESPGLNAVEHPIFDVWLTGCAQPLASRPTAKGAQPGQQGDPADEGTRRRVRR
jgi:hypothetical protein